MVTSTVDFPGKRLIRYSFGRDAAANICKHIMRVPLQRADGRPDPRLHANLHPPTKEISTAGITIRQQLPPVVFRSRDDGADRNNARSGVTWYRGSPPALLDAPHSSSRNDISLDADNSIGFLLRPFVPSHRAISLRLSDGG